MRNELRSVAGILLGLALLSNNGLLEAQPIISDREIDAAIQRGVAYLLRSQHAHGHWDARVRPDHGTLSGNNQGAITSLAVWALRSCEFDGRDSRIKRGALWSLSCDVKGSYGRAMRACMLSMMPKDYREYLKRDTTWLVDAMLPNGNFGPGKGGRIEDYGNHASGSYGMLGLRAAAEASLELKDKHWSRIGKHWRDAQDGEGGGWSYLKVGIPPETPKTDHWKHIPDGPMTAAAIAALYVSEYELYSRQMTGVGKNYISPNISNGIKFLTEHFDDDAGDVYFHYYNILLIGRSSGRRYFGEIDWFQRGAKLLVDKQNEDGSWSGVKGQATSTAFALLYLSRGMHPVVIGKLEFDGFWNNRPYDIGNFIHWLAPNLEWPLNWEIVNLKVDAAELLNIPALYLASHQAAKLSDTEIKTLRNYIHGGGMLVSTADAGSGGLTASIKKLADDLFPHYPMEKLAKDHPIHRLQYKPKRPKAVLAVSNGVRMLMMHIPSDISRSLQTRATVTDAKSFETLGNIAIYATGQKRLTNRFDTLYVPPSQRKVDRTFNIARLKYDGNWNPEPGAWPRFANLLQERTGTALRISDLAPQKLDKTRHDIAVMTGTTEFSFSPDQLRGLRDFIDGGGLLVADAAGLSMPFDTSFRQLASELWPDRRLKRIRADSPILTGKLTGCTPLPAALYRRFLVLRVGRPDLPDLFTIRDEQGTLRVAYSRYDLTTGLLGARAALIAGFHPDAATVLTQNIIMTYLNEEAAAPAAAAQPLKDEG